MICGCESWDRVSWDIASTENRSYVRSGNGICNSATSIILVIKNV
jgi:hypothetical protein